MKKKKTFIIILLLVAFLAYFSFNFVAVHADSGFDTSFDSGGFDSDWDSSGGGESGDPIVTLIIIIIVIIVCIVQAKKHKELMEKMKQESLALSEKIKQEIPEFDHDAFLKMAYQIYLDTQDAWMNFNYDKLRTLLSDELYNSYVSQLKTLSVKKQKNVMNSFNLVHNFITYYEKTEKEYVIKTETCVTFYDYIVDKNNKIVRGNNQNRVTNTYELTFVRSISKKSNKCPNCNAPLSNSGSNVCEYCNSVIVNNNHDWIMSKKENKRQR